MSDSRIRFTTTLMDANEKNINFYVKEEFSKNNNNKIRATFYEENESKRELGYVEYTIESNHIYIDYMQNSTGESEKEKRIKHVGKALHEFIFHKSIQHGKDGHVELSTGSSPQSTGFHFCEGFRLKSDTRLETLGKSHPIYNLVSNYQLASDEKKEDYKNDLVDIFIRNNIDTMKYYDIEKKSVEEAIEHFNKTNLQNEHNPLDKKDIDKFITDGLYYSVNTQNLITIEEARKECREAMELPGGKLSLPDETIQEKKNEYETATLYEVNYYPPVPESSHSSKLIQNPTSTPPVTEIKNNSLINAPLYLHL